MITGRDVMLYILQNNLEDVDLFKDGKLIGFMTVEDAAVKFNVGVETVTVWISLGVLPTITIGKLVYIPEHAKNPMEILSLKEMNDAYEAFKRNNPHFNGCFDR